ncbi:type I restriction endonuclease subunit M [Synechococcus sp. PCC 7336]|uniref:type I restriction endonuclease subunit M n=1 Tax=Synechococcus sp. PCC 7336 TaxID=195250 RepID=UPI002100A384|nr:type I restriction endonuclease subunit M [Synechococcus sp. PCC 7336]
MDEIDESDFVLTPGRYVGAAVEEDDGEPFAEKMKYLTQTLSVQLEKSKELEVEIKKNLEGLGYVI